MSTRSIESWRAEFPVLAGEGIYFLNNAMGAAPRGLRDQVLRYADEQLSLGDRGWGVWSPWLVAHADRLAAQIGAPASSVVLATGVTELLHRFISALDFSGPRNQVVSSALEFPSLNYAWQAWGRRGAELVRVPSPDGITVDEEAIAARIDERTAVVSLSLATYCSGALVDVARIARRAHACGAIVVVDAFQAYGIVPVDVEALGADVLISGTRKFGLGAGESAFMYVRPGLADSLPAGLPGWFAHAEPFAFTGEFVAASGSRRFESGSPTILPHYAAAAGLEVLLDVGAQAIRERSLLLTERIIGHADEQGLTLNTPRDPLARAGVVCLEFEGSGAAAQQLMQEGFACSHRPASGLRLGPHFFNTEDEVDRFMARIAAWRRAGPSR